MKVIINSGASTRKEYTNLPERGPDDLLRQRLGEKRIEEDRIAGEKPMMEQSSEVEEQRQHDFIEDYLADREPAEDDVRHEGQSWRHTRWAPFAFVGALLAIGAIWYFAEHFDRGLPLERITVRGASLLSEGEIVSLAAIDKDERFYHIDLKKLQARLLRHSLIKSAHPRRELNPSTIVLDVEERQPVAMLRSATNGEAFIIDRDGLLLQPKLIAGLRDPARLMQVPLLSGVSERDTVGYRAMARLVAMIQSADSGALGTAIGELHRTPTGAYVIYTSETQTPIFIGSPFDVAFRTALESQRMNSIADNSEPLFNRQIRLLAKVWKSKLQNDLRAGGALYVDARFSGQIILKHRQAPGHGSSLPSAMNGDSVKRSLISSVTTTSDAGHH